MSICIYLYVCIYITCICIHIDLANKRPPRESSGAGNEWARRSSAGDALVTLCVENSQKSAL